jgi:hypothetical protein
MIRLTSIESKNMFVANYNIKTNLWIEKILDCFSLSIGHSNCVYRLLDSHPMWIELSSFEGKIDHWF